MKSEHFDRYWAFACLGVLSVSYYPIYMGISVIGDMIFGGVVLKENYPKYIIPYTPICIAVLLGVIIMPLCMKVLKKFALPGGSAAALAAFFALETLFEKNVVVADSKTIVRLEDWQMFMCYQGPVEWDETATLYETRTPVDILLGEYDPAFKFHFYVISVLLILSLLNCLYGFAQWIKTGEKKRLKVLTLQSAATASFLGLCILACFTAFWRNGDIRVSPLSAALMIAFFILMGVTAGIYTGSFLVGKRKFVSILIPAAISSAMTVIMYVGEMILLNGYLYRFGTGFMFNGIPGIRLAPADILTVLASGCVTAVIFTLLNRKKTLPNKCSCADSKSAA